MKKKIGTLYGKPIVIGDDNLVSVNEISKDSIIHKEDNFIIKIYDSTDFIVDVFIIENDPDITSGTIHKYQYSKNIESNGEVDLKSPRTYPKVTLEGFKDGERQTIYFMIRHKSKSVEQAFSKFMYNAIIVTWDKDDDHSSSFDTYGAGCFSFSATMDSEESSIGVDRYLIGINESGKCKNILDCEAFIPISIRYEIS